jgi:hypothetical protein
MALTSETGTVVGDTIVYEYLNQGTAKGIGVVAYIDYVAGGSDTVAMKVKYNEEKVGEDYYYNVTNEGGLLKVSEYTFDGGAKYRFPIPISFNEESVILEFTGLVDGDINVEFSIDGAYH